MQINLKSHCQDKLRKQLQGRNSALYECIGWWSSFGLTDHGGTISGKKHPHGKKAQEDRVKHLDHPEKLDWAKLPRPSGAFVWNSRAKRAILPGSALIATLSWRA